MLEQEWASLVTIYQKQIALYEENKVLMEEKIQRMQKDMQSLESPDTVNQLREQMHHYRRQVDDVATKLREAEGFIEKQKAQLKNQGTTIDDLTRRCKELEDKQVQ